MQTRTRTEGPGSVHNSAQGRAFLRGLPFRYGRGSQSKSKIFPHFDTGLHTCMCRLSIYKDAHTTVK